MSEFIGMAYFAEIPITVIDVERMGPSTGLPTRTNQGDVYKLHILGHGDCKHIVLIPGSVSECFSLAAEAIDLAQEYQTPVFVASDLDLGMNLWLSDPFDYPEKPIRRGKVLNAEDLERRGGFERYRDVNGDGVCYRTVPGTEHPSAAYFTRGTGHNEKSGYSERPEDWKRNMDRLVRKLETARANLPKPIVDEQPAAQVGLIAYGSTDCAIGRSPRRPPRTRCNHLLLANPGVPVSDDIAAFVAKHDRVYVVEQNRDGQVYSLLRSILHGNLDDRLVSVTHYNGTPIAAVNISKPILDWERNFSEHGSLTNGFTPHHAADEIDDLSETTE